VPFTVFFAVFEITNVAGRVSVLQLARAVGEPAGVLLTLVNSFERFCGVCGVFWGFCGRVEGEEID
jgi:hypothetical protein